MSFSVLILKVLKETAPGDLPIEVNHPLTLVVNKESAGKMGVTIPSALLQSAQVIRG